MRRSLTIAGFIVAFCTYLASSLSALPCFPGVEGYGTQTPGGRGGRIIAVTNLNDSGPGSLRDACNAKGPRIVIFKVGGTIRLKKALRITEPFLTIAGQSAPGKGICLRDAVVSVETHDVVIRFIRVRVGPSLNEKFNDQNTIEVTGENTYNVVIDHCTFSWSIDENAGIVSRAHDVTFCNNIVSEALKQPFTSTQIGKERSHSMGFILGNYPNHCSVYRNLLAHCNSRMPRIQGGTHDFVNNVVYDWGFLTATFSREPNVNFVGNYYKPGPSSLPIKIIVDEGDDQGRIYVKGNRCPDRPKDDMDEWTPLTMLDPVKHRSMEPFATVPITTTTAEQAYEDVISGAGCRLPAMDDTDARIIRQVYMGAGAKIDRPEDVGGYPDLPVTFSKGDSDNDGIPDAYEQAKGLDPANPSDAAKIAKNGYSNIENYLNSLVDNWMKEPAKVVVYPVPDAVSDSPYKVIVNGKTVPIEKAGNRDGAYYARFQFTKIVRAVVDVKTQGKVDVELKPERFRDRLETRSNGISFDVCQGGPRVITVKADGKELWPLIVVAEEYDDSNPTSGARAVYNIKDYVKPTGIQTANIQKALDDCAAKQGGGVVYFPAGVYRTGTIRIKDNTTVYMAPGSLILGSEDPADYPVDPGKVEQGTHGPVCSFSRLVMFDHCKNSELIGYGVIDGNGHIVRNVKKRHVQLVDVTGSTSIKIENIVLRNSAEWTLHILGCDKVKVNNLKIINDWGVANTDGIDPDGSSNVRITRYFGYCGDDAVAIKTTGNSGLLKPAVNIEVKDSVVMTRKTSYKIGTETYADVYDVLFQDCEAVNSSRGIGLWVKDGATISNVTFRDIKLDLEEIRGEGMSGEPIRAVIEKRDGVGRIKDILFDRVSSSSPYQCVFEGLPESPLEEFDFWGCRFTVKPREIKTGGKPVLGIKNAKDFMFKFVYLNWLTEDPRNWNGFIGKENAENIVVREIQETKGIN